MEKLLQNMNSLHWESILSVAVGSILGLGMMGVMLFQRWLRTNADSQKEEREAAERQHKETLASQRMQQEASNKHLESLLHTMAAQGRKAEEKEAEATGPEAGGYIIFDMPDSKKSMFHDLLKGFEDYAKLRGYVINCSIDNTFPNKVAFKFTLDGSGINVSTGQVRQDLKEYMQKVQRGESLDDMPVVLSVHEHALVVSCLKNRISLLEHNYNLTRTQADFLEKLLMPVSVLDICTCCV